MPEPTILISIALRIFNLSERFWGWAKTRGETDSKPLADDASLQLGPTTYEDANGDEWTTRSAPPADEI
jgi:hypothetical protein